MEQAKIEAIQSVADAINRLAEAVMSMSVAPTPTAAEPTPTAAPEKKKRKDAAVKISDALATFIGSSAQTPMTRQEATAEVMKYVKAKALQMESDKRKIEPDAALAALVGSSETINVLNLKSSLATHFTVISD